MLFDHDGSPKIDFGCYAMMMMWKTFSFYLSCSSSNIRGSDTSDAGVDDKDAAAAAAVAVAYLVYIVVVSAAAGVGAHRLHGPVVSDRSEVAYYKYSVCSAVVVLQSVVGGLPPPPPSSVAVLVWWLSYHTHNSHHSALLSERYTIPSPYTKL